MLTRAHAHSDLWHNFNFLVGVFNSFLDGV